MDFRATITHSIVRLIESGSVASSSSPLWDAACTFGLPLNFFTRKAYAGVNVPILWAAAAERGLASNEWLTFKQALALGACVRKGAKGVMCVKYKLLDKSETTTCGETLNSKIPMLKPFWLFNVADIEGLALAPLSLLREDFSPIANAEFLLVASGAKITWAGTRAFYRQPTDEIFMPERNRFTSSVNAYAVALHELTHFTGHTSRLNRDFSGRFGSASYAFEELVAELGSAFLVSHLGLRGATLEHHANYTQSWLTVLKNDTSAIFSASKHASAAFDFLLQFAPSAATFAEPAIDEEAFA